MDTVQRIGNRRFVPYGSAGIPEGQGARCSVLIGRGAKPSSAPEMAWTSRFSARSPVCLHWRLCGTTCLVDNLAAIRGARHVGHSKGVLTVVIGGFFIFALTQMLLRLWGRRASVSRENLFHTLGMPVAFVLPFSMLLLLPVGFYKLNWFFPALMILVGAHYLPFA